MLNDDQKVVAKQLIKNIEAKPTAVGSQPGGARSSTSGSAKPKAKAAKEEEEKQTQESLGLRKALSYFT